MPSLAKDFYLTGEFNGWTPNQSAVKFQETEGVYTLELKEIRGELKITTSAWEEQYGCESEIQYGITYPVIMSGNGYNMSLPENPAKDITIIFDYNEKTIRFDKNVDLYLVGDFNEWMPLPKYKFRKAADIYELRINNFVGRFKIATEDYSLSFGKSGELIMNEESPVVEDGEDMNFNGAGENGKIKITFNPYSSLNEEESPSLPEDGDQEPPQDPEEEFSKVDKLTFNPAGSNSYYDLTGKRARVLRGGIYILRDGNNYKKIYIP